MINEKLIYHFANVIGYLKIAINLESLKVIRTKYEMVLDELLKWTKYYYENKNLLYHIDGKQDKEKVFRSIEKILGSENND